MQPTFSIIIPAYNEENQIRQTLHSIKQQTLQSYEVIVVANGCTDKTEELVKKRSSEKIRLLSLPKPNVCVARNAGALNAEGKILIFLDADTQLAADSLLLIKESYGMDHSVATTQVRPDIKKSKYSMVMHGKNALMKSKIFKGFSGILICNKEDFHAVGGYNPDVTIREHHELRKKLEEKGKYICVNTHVTTSMRRLEQWSLARSSTFWLKQAYDHYRGKDLKEVEYEKIR